MVRQINLSEQEIATALKECLHFVANGSDPENIDATLIVLDAWGLDSEQGVELACDLSARLGIEIPDSDNPLIDETGRRKRARTFGQVVDYIVGLSNH